MQIFRVSLMLVHLSSKKMCLNRYLTYHLKAYRTSNNMVLKLSAQRVRKKFCDFKKLLKLLVILTNSPPF